MSTRVRWGLLTLLPVVYLGYFFLYPLATILATALGGEGGDATLTTIASRPSLRGVAWFTTWQAALSTLITVLLGVPGAYVLARYEFRGRRLVRTLTIIPFVLPTVVVGTAFLALIGPRGALGVDLSRTVIAILVAHVFFNYAIVVRTVGTYWEQLDPSLEEAARTLGASATRAFREVTLPLLAPAIASAASIVFLFTFTSFGIILILGGLQHATIEVEIWRQAVGLLDLRVAAALALLQLAGVAGILWVYSRYQAKRSRQLSVSVNRPRLPVVGRRRLILGANLGIMALLLGSPIAVLVWRSVQSGAGLSLSAYTGLTRRSTGEGLFVPPTTAIWNSLQFALVAAALAVVIGSMAAAVVAYRKGPTGQAFDALLMLPLGTSAVTLGFGFLLALDAPLDLRTSPWLIPIAHSLVAIPFVVRIAVPVMRRVRSRLREAAMMLGASPEQAWREIDFPLVARAIVVGGGFAVAVSLGEFGATSFIARPDTPTLPIAIFRLLGRPGSITFGRAMALSVILMAVTAVAVLAVERLRPGGGEDF